MPFRPFRDSSVIWSTPRREAGVANSGVARLRLRETARTALNWLLETDGFIPPGVDIELDAAIERTVTVPRKDGGEPGSSAQVVVEMLVLAYLAFVIWGLALRNTTDPLPGGSGA